MYTLEIVNQIALVALFAVASSQVVMPWTGPFADNAPGLLVGDTPEVAAAKRQHLEAHAQIRAILPELPEEEKFPNANAPIIPQAPVVQHPLASVQHPHIHHHVQPTFPVTSQPQITQFAEEIPRSIIGEVPEVHAARQAHLKAYAEARAALPALRSEEYSTVSPFVAQPVAQPWNQGPVDTPEVAAAKLEHARAVAAAYGR